MEFLEVEHIQPLEFPEKPAAAHLPEGLPHATPVDLEAQAHNPPEPSFLDRLVLHTSGDHAWKTVLLCVSSFLICLVHPFLGLLFSCNNMFTDRDNIIRLCASGFVTIVVLFTAFTIHSASYFFRYFSITLFTLLLLCVLQGSFERLIADAVAERAGEFVVRLVAAAFGH